MIGFVTGILLIGGSVLAFRIAVGILRDKVVTVLGPGSEISALRVGWSTVEVEGLRIQGGAGLAGNGRAPSRAGGHRAQRAHAPLGPGPGQVSDRHEAVSVGPSDA